MSDLQQDCVCQNVGLANATKATLEIGVRRQAGLLVLAPVGGSTISQAPSFRRDCSAPSQAAD